MEEEEEEEESLFKADRRRKKGGGKEEEEEGEGRRRRKKKGREGGGGKEAPTVPRWRRSEDDSRGVSHMTQRKPALPSISTQPGALSYGRGGEGRRGGGK